MLLLVGDAEDKFAPVEEEDDDEAEEDDDDYTGGYECNVFTSPQLCASDGYDLPTDSLSHLAACCPCCQR